MHPQATEREREDRRTALAALLWQLADDDLVVAQRASEWLGLHPHVEEDVAFASIAQDELGHAAMYYGLLEELGFGPRDDLALLRPIAERRNSVLLEWPNGDGEYWDEPHFDWAFALLRHFAYDTFEQVRLERLRASSHRPLAELAIKILREERYHLAHHTMWIRRLAGHDAEARARLVQAGQRVAELAGDLWDTGGWAPAWERFGLMADPDGLRAAWEAAAVPVLEAAGLPVWEVPAPRYNGRRGVHSPYGASLVDTMATVVRLDPRAQW
jgi:ring-1,2-phenylacetyl-CoA epoxidase subunit PaaC